MLVCQCNVITSRDVEATVRELLGEDPWQLIVPAKVYHRMHKRGRCCGCFPNVVDIIITVTEKYHLELGAADERRNRLEEGLVALRNQHRRDLPLGGLNEGRTAGHRTA